MPQHRYTDYVHMAEIQESPKISNGTEAVAEILKAFSTLLPLQREILALATDAEDEGTNALMGDYIRTQEKQVWMYSAFSNTTR